MNSGMLGKTLLWILIIAAGGMLVLKSVFDIDGLELTRGFSSWLYDLIWGNRAYRHS